MGTLMTVEVVEAVFFRVDNLEDTHLYLLRLDLAASTLPSSLGAFF